MCRKENIFEQIFQKAVVLIVNCSCGTVIHRLNLVEDGYIQVSFQLGSVVTWRTDTSVLRNIVIVSVSILLIFPIRPSCLSVRRSCPSIVPRLLIQACTCIVGGPDEYTWSIFSFRTSVHSLLSVLLQHCHHRRDETMALRNGLCHPRHA